MKLSILAAFALVLFASCSSKKWDKDYVNTKCKNELKKQMGSSALLSEDKVGKICDCIADKMVAKYKSESEADKDTGEGEVIAKECTLAAMQPSN